MFEQKINEPTRELLVNYYKWALADIQREINENFPLMKNIKGSGVQTYLRYLDLHSLEDKLKIAGILVKGFNKIAIEECNETLSDSENLIRSQFHEFYMAGINKPIETWRVPEKNKIDTKRLSKLIRGNLTGICGEIQRGSRTNDWFHEIRAGDWVVTTWVSLSRTQQQIRYNHSITMVNDPDPYVLLIDVLRWMGVNATEWNELEHGDEEIACEQLTALCKHFVDALPTILPTDK